MHWELIHTSLALKQHAAPPVGAPRQQRAARPRGARGEHCHANVRACGVGRRGRHAKRTDRQKRAVEQLSSLTQFFRTHTVTTYPSCRADEVLRGAACWAGTLWCVGCSLSLGSCRVRTTARSSAQRRNYHKSLLVVR